MHVLSTIILQRTFFFGNSGTKDFGWEPFPVEQISNGGQSGHWNCPVTSWKPCQQTHLPGASKNKNSFYHIIQHTSITVAFLAKISLEEFTSIFRLNEFEFYWFKCTNLENVFLHVNESKRMSSDKFVWVNYGMTSVIF